VSERDAFGNPIAESGGGGDARPVTGGDPLVARAAAPPPPPFPTVPPIPTYAPARTGWWERAIVAAVVIGFVAPFALGGWVAWNAWHAVKPAIGVVKSVRDRAPATPPRGVTGASLLAAGNLAAVLRAARRDPGGRLGLLRLAPERADLQLARRDGGGLDLLQLRADGGRSLVHTQGAGPTKAISYSAIDVEAPARLVRAAAERLHRSPAAIDYLVLADVLGGPRWSAYFQGGAAFGGDAHGRVTRRIE
jgi:hypothetical protein